MADTLIIATYILAGIGTACGAWMLLRKEPLVPRLVLSLVAGAIWPALLALLVVGMWAIVCEGLEDED